MTEHESIEFVKEEFLPLWPKWAESVSFYEKQKWITFFKEFTPETARKVLDRYYDSSDFTMQRPKKNSIRKYIPSGISGGHKFVWIQNTQTGIFYPLYYPASKDCERILSHWFKEHHPNGQWTSYLLAEKSHDELRNYQVQMEKVLHKELGTLEMNPTQEAIDDFCEKYGIPLDSPRIRKAKKIPAEDFWTQKKEVLNL
jgi:hypothetical protein